MQPNRSQVLGCPMPTGAFDLSSDAHGGAQTFSLGQVCGASQLPSHAECGFLALRLRIGTSWGSDLFATALPFRRFRDLGEWPKALHLG